MTLEKWQGAAIKPYTWEEDAWVVAAKQIKARNPKTAVVVWYDSVRIYQQNRTLNPNIKGGCTTGNFMPGKFLDAHVTPYLLMTSNGSGPAVERMGCHIHNQANRQSQLYWQEMCLNMTRSGVIDGCGCDASWMDGEKQAAQWGVTKEAGQAWGVGHRTMLRELSWNLLGDGITLGKQADEVGDYVNGVLGEECTPSNNTINMLRSISALARSQKRRLIYECHYKPKDSPPGTTVMDSIAAFLVGVGEFQYFGLGAWENRVAWTGNPKYGGFNLTDHWVDGAFGRKLGAPLADAEYDAEQRMWRRSFLGGTQVEFRLTNASFGTGNITWGGAGAGLFTSTPDNSAKTKSDRPAF